MIHKAQTNTSIHVQRERWVCLDCRKMFRPYLAHDAAAAERRAQAEPSLPMLCPQCRRPMQCVGRYFKPPKQRDMSGYVFDTVPVALHAWLRHPDDFGAAVRAVLRCGGDTDTTAVIVGGIVGARVGKSGIPVPLLNGLCEWPRSIAWMERLGRRLSAVAASG